MSTHERCTKNHYIAVQIEENGKMAAYVIRAGENENLVSVLAGIKGLVSANIWPKARAERAVRTWNDCFMANGRYLFTAKGASA